MSGIKRDGMDTLITREHILWMLQRAERAADDTGRDHALVVLGNTLAVEPVDGARADSVIEIIRAP